MSKKNMYVRRGGVKKKYVCKEGGGSEIFPVMPPPYPFKWNSPYIAQGPKSRLTPFCANVVANYV